MPPHGERPIPPPSSVPPVRPTPETGVTATVVHVDGRDGAETIRLSTGHEIQFGYGSGGDGYCYAHGSFSCVENLTDEENEAVKRAS